MLCHDPPSNDPHGCARDGRVVRERYRALDSAFGAEPHALHYALKANSTMGMVRLVRSLGAQVDANSGGEIELALRAGYAPDQIVFTGVGKTPAELEQAVRLGLKTINAESPGELGRIDLIAQALDARARVALRVNPDIDAHSHPHISTGLKRNKFGVALDSALTPVKVGKQLQAAAALGARFAVVVGPDEWATGEVTLKNLATGVPVKHRFSIIIPVLHESELINTHWKR